MKSAVEKVLIEALDALEAGDDLEVIMERYPQHEAELRPVLTMAASMANIRVAHSLEAQAVSRQRMLDYAAASVTPVEQRPSFLPWLRRLSLAAAALVVVLALLGTGVLFASAETIPGDGLYDAKRFFEDTRLSLTGDSAAREALQQRHEEERIREIQTLIRLGRSQEVTFAGMIEAIDGDNWLVAGLQVTIVNATSIDGTDDPAVGQIVQISGLVVNGSVQASIVTIRGAGDLPSLIPEPGISDTPVARPGTTRTPTPTATPTNTPTPTPTSDETTPEASPTHTPTVTPTPESNENGNTNDNENEGGGNSNENEEDNENESNSRTEDSEREENDNDHDENGNERDENDNERDENDNERDENENDNDREGNENENRNGNSALLDRLAI